MVGVLDVLADRGLVERVRSNEDRRRHTVALTAEGEAMRIKIKQAAHEVEDRLFAESEMTHAEWEMLINLMQKLTQREDENG